MNKLNLQTLETKLWDCANVLRGTLSSSQYMDYIFGMMFLKRMNDQFDLESRKIKEDNDQIPKEFIEQMIEDATSYETFFVPESARWEKLKDLNLNIGPELDKAFKAIEDEPKNTELIGVLTTANYNDKERVPDAKLNQLLQIFDSINLSNEGLEKPDILGDAYMYLLKQFADDGGKKGGEFYTPEGIKEVMVQVLQPKETDSIYDPTTGSAGFLINAIEYVKKQGKNHRNVQAYGQEINLSTWAIAKLNMLLHDAKGSIIWKGDTIRDPQNKEGATLKTFDKVIANPPFSLKNWGIETAENNSYHRFSYGVPPKSYGDFAFVEHMIASLNSKGKMATVVPHGILFRGGAEGKIRQGILEDDLFEAIIGLPSNLFYGTGIPAAILVLNKNKPVDRKGNVLFIDASDHFVKNGNMNELREEDIQGIVDAYNQFETIEKFAQVVSLEDIRENDYNLNISRYVDTTEAEPEIDINAVTKRIKEREGRLVASRTQINGFLRELGFGEI
ncbi:type I restriction-modification system subunit M [Marinisporobacter balticus]|uniref:site-specific DNA-methyltransferase (adenine-specific) n=1 Tax=Marinisporobacter balticus TaxID=2018667 RepID=A0A4R2KKW4_9FIRM|nr:type I restriction-modification system subunit M [Marinisporobacter balticus]TCO70668.1 type I restriction enzyme M protein [Marinisporobacter balticus]